MLDKQGENGRKKATENNKKQKKKQKKERNKWEKQRKRKRGGGGEKDQTDRDRVWDNFIDIVEKLEYFVKGLIWINFNHMPQLLQIKGNISFPHLSLHDKNNLTQFFRQTYTRGQIYKYTLFHYILSMYTYYLF